jgi:uncharacterized protein
MKRSLLKEGTNFAIFGGEPLLTPIEALDELFAFGFEHWGKNGIQTNGVLITDVHIEMFKKYNVQVGISIDGPGAMNNARISNNGRTEEATINTLSNVEKLFNAGLSPTIIATLHALNVGTEELLEQFVGWLSYLDHRGMRHMTLHMLEPDGEVDNLIVSSETLVRAFEVIHSVKFRNLKFDIFDHMTQLLTGDVDKATCVWHACDPYTTDAVRGVDADGTRTNCGRTNKDGVSWRKADRSGHERQLVLYNTPQEYNGCKGCKFFIVCKGYCPGTSIDGDWRNRTVHCRTIYGLLELEEKKLLARGVVPVSDDSKRIQAEKNMFAALGNVRANGHGDAHGDVEHGDWHGDIEHGDIPHGDSNERVPVERVRATPLTCGCVGPCRGHRA